MPSSIVFGVGAYSRELIDTDDIIVFTLVGFLLNGIRAIEVHVMLYVLLSSHDLLIPLLGL